MCICPPGWFGDLCHLTVDFCQSNPCLNGGTCTPSQNRYDCTCPTQYNGTRCELVVPNCGYILFTSSYLPTRDFSSLCEINIIDHPAYINIPCRDLIAGINHYNTSSAIIAQGGTFGCYVTRFPDEIPNGACINNYNQGQTLAGCLSCTHMGVCIKLPPNVIPTGKRIH